jgi:nucleotide-binding universal stress UspA family protein
MYDDILFPTDGSAGADAALDHAIEQALNHDATLHVLYVVEENIPVAEVSQPDVLDELEAEGKRIVEAARHRATEAGLESVQGTVGGGSPYRVILEYVDDHGIGLVVMGTHGRSGLDRLLLGSVAERIVRTADCPVMTVRAAKDDVETEAEEEE